MSPSNKPDFMDQVLNACMATICVGVTIVALSFLISVSHEMIQAFIIKPHYTEQQDHTKGSME